MYDPMLSEFDNITLKLMDLGVHPAYIEICPISKDENTDANIAEYAAKYVPSEVQSYKSQAGKFAMFACTFMLPPPKSIEQLAYASCYFRSLMYDAGLTKEECQLLIDFANRRLGKESVEAATLCVKKMMNYAKECK